jgi:hypothetical protein
MPTAIFDASLLTQKKRDRAVYTFSQAVDKNVFQSSVRTITTGQNSLEVVIQKNIGACVCNADLANRNGCTCGGAPS